VDLRRRELIASWATGQGDVAESVGALPSGLSEADALAVVDALATLSDQLWHTYAHPASGEDSVEPDSEGWHRAEERKAFDRVASAVRAPNLAQDGLQGEYVAVEEAAHRLGRALHDAGDQGLTAQIVRQVEADLAAIAQAEGGELAGRGTQAVLLTRTDAAPSQVAAADALLRESPFGDERLYTQVEPTAAAIAAAGWLAAAAWVAATATGVAFTEVVTESDEIEPLLHESPTLVLEAIEAGAEPQDIVLDLIWGAMQAAKGRIPDLPALLRQVADAAETAARPGEQDLVAELLPTRTTTLDPARPALDLLEDLLSGIRGCWLLYLRRFGESPDAEIDQVTATFLDQVRKRVAG
jgi:hypothetical protein